MQLKVVWQMGSSNPDNAENLATIGHWWSALAGQEITWRQRILPTNGSATIDDLDWEVQRFDEMFVLAKPELRGITLFWQRPDSPQERSLTVSKLELYPQRQQLFLYSQSQKELVVRVALPQPVYQVVRLNPSSVEGQAIAGGYVLTLRDSRQMLEIVVTLDDNRLSQLKQQLG